MGFEDRDYSQQESWSSTGPVETHVTKWFVILTVGAFILQALTNSSVMFELLSLKADAVLQGQVWRLFTFAICHSPPDIIGLVFSLLIIWRFGIDLERMYGSTEILCYYIAMIGFVGLSFVLWGFIVPLSAPIAGSFTVALGLLTLFATHFPRIEVYILPLITIQLRWLVALYAVFGLYPALMIIQQGGGLLGLAYASTVHSILFALAYRRYDWHLSAFTHYFRPGAVRRFLRSRFSRRQLRVYKPATEPMDLDSKVDALLAKIHEHGSESLTDEERAILMRASDRMKNRS
jgi:membrane associated rhomboid family serine protease